MPCANGHNNQTQIAIESSHFYSVIAYATFFFVPFERVRSSIVLLATLGYIGLWTNIFILLLSSSTWLSLVAELQIKVVTWLLGSFHFIRISDSLVSFSFSIIIFHFYFFLGGDGNTMGQFFLVHFGNEQMSVGDKVRQFILLPV